MAIKTIGIDKEISTTDQLRFVLSTTNAAECLNGMQSLFTPYKVNQVTIYFIARDFTESTVSEYNKDIYDNNLLSNYEKQKIISCEDPSENNIKKLNNLKKELEQSKKTYTYFFKEAVPVKVFGGYTNEFGELFPAWINPDLVPDPDEKEKVIRDNILQLESNGKFILEWNPVGCREGDYFICWNWTPNLAGPSQSAHMNFRLLGDSKLNTSIPTHYTNKDKYQILLDRYLPDMYKNFISEGDLTPMIMEELNASVAKGFTFVEDMANQIIDLLDSNSTQEQLLPLLSNTFNLRLKSYDPILWRRQIKKAIPNFKKKGTIGGLKTALGDAGMRFLKITKLWQVVSKYTYQEHFSFDYLPAKLSKNIILPVDEDNFEIHYRLKNTNNWIAINPTDPIKKSDYISISQQGTEYYINWVGGSLSSDAISLSSGDSIRILYQYKEIPNSSEQNLENYIRSLDLMDQRDERNQEYPPKNWNTRLVEDDDPLFDLLIPIRHPIQDLVVWGKVRTEFPYSENVYNMEEYNGSTRDSFNPCDISKDFIDPCAYCQASKVNFDIEVEDLSNDRIIECDRLIEEFVPFHTLIHTINFLGSVNEFVKPPIEEVVALISFFGEEILISGDAQNIFNRSIARGRELSPGEFEGFQDIKREMLSQMNTVASDVVSTGRNESIVLFCPSLSSNEDLENPDFINKTNKIIKDNIDYSYLDGTAFENSNLLEILRSPKQNYSVRKLTKNSYKVIGNVAESPLDKSQFEFRISNKIYSQSGVKLEKDNEYVFSSNFNFTQIKIITKEESANCYKINIQESGYNSYKIIKILSDNSLILEGPMPDNNISEINWQLLDENDNAVQELDQSIEGNDGSIKIKLRALVNLSHSYAPSIGDIRDLAKIGDYVLYDGSQYKINSFIKNEEYKFYIENYQGSIGSAEIKIYRRIIENCIGQLDYMGLILDVGTTLSINDEEKQNYLILMHPELEPDLEYYYYSILNIDGNTLYLEGPRPTEDWTTNGTNVNFTVYNFVNKEITIPERAYPPIPGHTFEQIKRSNNDVITKQIKTNTSFLAARMLNSINSGDQLFEISGQSENINISIEYKDGNKEEKNI